MESTSKVPAEESGKLPTHKVPVASTAGKLQAHQISHVGPKETEIRVVAPKVVQPVIQEESKREKDSKTRSEQPSFWQSITGRFTFPSWGKAETRKEGLKLSTQKELAEFGAYAKMKIESQPRLVPSASIENSEMAFIDIKSLPSQIDENEYQAWQEFRTQCQTLGQDERQLMQTKWERTADQWQAVTELGGQDKFFLNLTLEVLFNKEALILGDIEKEARNELLKQYLEDQGVVARTFVQNRLENIGDLEKKVTEQQRNLLKTSASTTDQLALAEMKVINNEIKTLLTLLKNAREGLGSYEKKITATVSDQELSKLAPLERAKRISESLRQSAIELESDMTKLEKTSNSLMQAILGIRVIKTARDYLTAPSLASALEKVNAAIKFVSGRVEQHVKEAEAKTKQSLERAEERARRAELRQDIDPIVEYDYEAKTPEGGIKEIRRAVIESGFLAQTITKMPNTNDEAKDSYNELSDYLRDEPATVFRFTDEAALTIIRKGMREVIKDLNLTDKKQTDHFDKLVETVNLGEFIKLVKKQEDFLATPVLKQLIFIQQAGGVKGLRQQLLKDIESYQHEFKLQSIYGVDFLGSVKKVIPDGKSFLSYLSPAQLNELKMELRSYALEGLSPEEIAEHLLRIVKNNVVKEGVILQLVKKEKLSERALKELDPQSHSAWPFGKAVSTQEIEDFKLLKDAATSGEAQHWIAEFLADQLAKEVTTRYNEEINARKLIHSAITSKGALGQPLMKKTLKEAIADARNSFYEGVTFYKPTDTATAEEIKANYRKFYTITQGVEGKGSQYVNMLAEEIVLAYAEDVLALIPNDSERKSLQALVPQHLNRFVSRISKLHPNDSAVKSLQKIQQEGGLAGLKEVIRQDLRRQQVVFDVACEFGLQGAKTANAIIDKAFPKGVVSLVRDSDRRDLRNAIMSPQFVAEVGRTNIVTAFMQALIPRFNEKQIPHDFSGGKLEAWFTSHGIMSRALERIQDGMTKEAYLLHKEAIQDALSARFCLEIAPDIEVDIAQRVVMFENIQSDHSLEKSIDDLHAVMRADSEWRTKIFTDTEKFNTYVSQMASELIRNRLIALRKIKGDASEGPIEILSNPAIKLMLSPPKEWNAEKVQNFKTLPAYKELEKLARDPLGAYEALKQQIGKTMNVERVRYEYESNDNFGAKAVNLLSKVMPLVVGDKVPKKEYGAKLYSMLTPSTRTNLEKYLKKI